MKRFILCLSILALLLIALWPEETYDNKKPHKALAIKKVVDGNTVELDNGTTIHLIGVTSTNEGMQKLSKLNGTPVRIIPDSESPYNPNKLNKRSAVYAYLIDENSKECINSMLLKNRLADINETRFLKDSLHKFKEYAHKAKQARRQQPTPIYKSNADYNEDNIELPDYSFDTERKHTIWYNNGNLNLEMLETVCDYTLPYTKNFANQLAGRVEGSYNFRQVCEIFNYCYKKWEYVSDPKDSEFVAKASESIAFKLRGDCDDFAVLMASCILAIGGDASITIASNRDSAHAYAELNITDMDIEGIKKVLAETYPHLSIQDIAIRHDNYGTWLSLDWQAEYPGGPYWESEKRSHYCRRDGSWIWYR